MPYSDPEKRREYAREAKRRYRAEGRVDPAAEAERKARWYAEGGGKQKRLEADRKRLADLRETKINDIPK